VLKVSVQASSVFGMEIPTDTTTAHPVLACAEAISHALDTVAHVDPMFMATSDKAHALVELTRLTDRLEGLRLRVIAGAGEVAAQDGSRHVGTWLGPRTMTDTSPNTAAQLLAGDLDSHWHQVAAGLNQGSVNLAQAKVIVRALNQLGEDVAPDLVARAEAHLVAQAAHFTPSKLKVLGDKILEVIAPDDYDDAERKNLEEQQRRASAATRLTFRKRGDGATDISARVPDSIAARLKAYLEAFTSPRRKDGNGNGTDGSGAGDGTGGPGAGGPGAGGPITDPATGQRIPTDRKNGHAFCALLEALDPAALPIHGGNATTLVITINWDDLNNGTGGATLPDGSRISAGEARRLACTAGLLPAVLGSDSEVLDLGRTRRLFTPAQRRALGIEYPTCRAEGCTIPATWCEAHHATEPWCQGGKTDLADADLLCNWHHHRAHDETYNTQRLPNGAVRFHKRT
jgi:hypothetical protein